MTFKKQVEASYIVARKTTKLLENPEWIVTVDETGKAGNAMNRKSLKTVKWSADPEIQFEQEGVPETLKQEMSMLVGTQAS